VLQDDDAPGIDDARRGQPAEQLARLDEARIVNPGGIVVLEHARERPVPERVGSLRHFRSRGHGKTSISVYEQAAED
jgi:16S rRNA G966 N2-methylase RsmD